MVQTVLELQQWSNYSSNHVLTKMSQLAVDPIMEFNIRAHTHAPNLEPKVAKKKVNFLPSCQFGKIQTIIRLNNICGIYCPNLMTVVYSD